jgi:hypothetical protein
MSLLRLLSVLILAIWVGGAAVLGGVAAPTIFSVLEAHDPQAGRTLAGAVFGAVFARFQQLSWILGGLLIVVMALRAALGPRPRRFGLRLWGLAAMIAASLTTAFAIAPRIDAIRHETAGPVAALPDGDARKVELGRLHGLSTGLMFFAMGAGVALIFAEMKDH